MLLSARRAQALASYRSGDVDDPIRAARGSRSRIEQIFDEAVLGTRAGCEDRVGNGGKRCRFACCWCDEIVVFFIVIDNIAVGRCGSAWRAQAKYRLTPAAEIKSASVLTVGEDGSIAAR